MQIQKLLTLCEVPLNLSWYNLANTALLDQPLQAVSQTIVGLYNPIRIPKITILGKQEIVYFNQLNLVDLAQEICIFKNHAHCVIISIPFQSLTQSLKFLPYFDAANIPILLSLKPEKEVFQYLQRTIHNLTAPTENMQGNLIEIFNLGVHLSGESGSGKSSLSYQLISRGHRLIADDVVLYQLDFYNNIVGSAYKCAYGKLHLPSKGVIDIKKHFGPQALKLKTELNLILNLHHNKQQDLRSIKNKPKISHRLILGNKVPELTLHQSNKCGAICIENFIKDFLFSQDYTQDTSKCDIYSK